MTWMVELTYFNSQPHKEADDMLYPLKALPQNFNSQPHKEADNRNRTPAIQTVHFNSQPHKEADGQPDTTQNIELISTHSLTRRLTFCHYLHLRSCLFQLTASQGGWPVLYVAMRVDTANFNSQPHKEADNSLYGWLEAGSHFNSQPHKEADRCTREAEKER